MKLTRYENPDKDSIVAYMYELILESTSLKLNPFDFEKLCRLVKSIDTLVDRDRHYKNITLEL
jgi:hypothetical protein